MTSPFVYLCFSHFLRSPPEFSLGQKSVTVPIVNVESQSGSLADRCLTNDIRSAAWTTSGSSCTWPDIHLDELVQADTAVAVLVVASDRPLDPFSVWKKQEEGIDWYRAVFSNRQVATRQRVVEDFQRIVELLSKKYKCFFLRFGGNLAKRITKIRAFRTC